MVEEEEPLEFRSDGVARTTAAASTNVRSLGFDCRPAMLEPLANDRLGYREAVAGCHNTVDQWQVQPYMAPDSIDAADAIQKYKIASRTELQPRRPLSAPCKSTLSTCTMSPCP